MAEQLEHLGGLLAIVGSRSQPRHPLWDIYVRDLRLDSGIKLPTRDFRSGDADANAGKPRCYFGSFEDSNDSEESGV